MKLPTLLAATALVFAGRLSAETVPPTVVSASVAPSSVDVTSAAQNVTVTFHITDDSSGVDFGNAYLFDEANKFVTLVLFAANERTSGTELDGTYSVDLTVPRYAQPGLWRVEAFVRDHAGNQVNYNPNQTSFPDPPAMKFTVVNSGPVDDVEPTLDSASVSPPEVDTTTVQATVNFTVAISDALSGFDFGFVNLTDPDGQYRYEISPAFGDGERISGDGHSGVYLVSVNLPQGSKAGTWTYRVSGKDKAGNSLETPVLGSFTVISTPSLTPTSRFLAQAVDAVHLPWSSSGGGWVIQSQDTHDGTDAAASLPIPDGGSATIQTTITGPGDLSFQWRVDSEQDLDFLSVSIDGGAPVQSISGNINWSRVIIGLPPGEHTVAWTYAKNGGGVAGDDRGWLDEVRFQRNEDLDLPVLQSLEISPRLADISGGPVNVNFTIAATDDFNGILEGHIELFDANGNPQVSTTFNSGSNFSGDELDSHWQVTLEIPGTAQSGLWRAEITLTEDISGATRHYGGSGDPFPAKRVEYFHVGTPDDVDSDAPRVQELSVTPGTVDVTNGMATAFVTVQLTDTVRGFSHGDVTVNNPDDNRTGTFYFQGADRISGDEFNGIYQIEVSVPAYGQSGTWTVSASVTDNGGARKEYPYEIGFPAGVDPTFQVLNSGAVDVTIPEITAVDISPNPVDTSGAPAQIQVTISIADDLSGIFEAYAFFYNPDDVFQNDISPDFIGSRISGNELSGVYQINRTLPQGSAAGQWRVRVFLRDKAGNAVFYGENATAYPEPGDGYFTVGGTVQSVFAAYVAGFGLTGNDALPSADPDHDGLNNATEALLGTNPANSASSGAGLISTTRDATKFYLNFTIASSLTATANGTFLEFGNGGGGAPLRLTGQTQAGLTGPWSNVLPEHVTGRDYRIGIPFASGSKGFARLFFEDP